MARKRASKTAKEVEDDLEIDEDVDPEEGSPLANPLLVSRYIRMWPRAVFSTPVQAEGLPGKPPAIGMTIEELEKPGVYILYRDDVPFYVGQAKGKLRDRLRAHANSVGGLRTYFWNYFSAFIVENPGHIDEVEATLISAMPSIISNSSKPRIKKVRMGPPTKELMRELRKKGHY